MDFERTIETQQLKLLRLVAGLVVLVGFLSVGPVSRVFSASVCGFVGSILSRAEAAARYLVIAKARLMVARSGIAVDQSRFSEFVARAFEADEADVSLPDCRARLKALRAVLLDLPRHALRLIRRIEKQIRRAARTGPLSPCPDERSAAPLRDWRLAALRIERPPDKPVRIAACPTSPRIPGGRRRRLGSLHIARCQIRSTCRPPFRRPCTRQSFGGLLTQ